MVDDPAAKYFGAPMTDESLVPTGNHTVRIGPLSFADWLAGDEGRRHLA
ncbi:hypothetical protein [Actinoplanes subtropicus]|nr:hypothetical protein [Actinoplanes subtropicus]